MWVFSNEVADPPVGQLEPGSIHDLMDSGGEFIGTVYANPAGLITARILSGKKETIDEDFFRRKIGTALECRKRLYPDRNVYRLVFGEGDLLPGLIVDRYDDVLVVQTLTAGMDGLVDTITDALVDLIAPKAIYLRNDSPYRELEGLAKEKKVAYGEIPEYVEVEIEGIRYRIDVVNGQKTGHFLDQESNRRLVGRHTFSGAKVLDMFCYNGGWSLHALSAGAELVVGVDSSRPALELALANATLNGLEDRFEPVRSNALEFLKRAQQLWDVIVLDPPAFIKSKSHINEGRKGYIDINTRALKRLTPNGVLITCSCSHHMDQSLFEAALVERFKTIGASAENPRRARTRTRPSHAAHHARNPLPQGNRRSGCLRTNLGGRFYKSALPKPLPQYSHLTTNLRFRRSGYPIA